MLRWFRPGDGQESNQNQTDGDRRAADVEPENGGFEPEHDIVSAGRYLYPAQAKAARWLGISRLTMKAKLVQFGLYPHQDLEPST
jgi:hypothetical protein